MELADAWDGANRHGFHRSKRRGKAGGTPSMRRFEEASIGIEVSVSPAPVEKFLMSMTRSTTHLSEKVVVLKCRLQSR